MSESAKGSGPFLLGIDYGTESCRAGIFDTDGRPLATEATTYALTHPRPGWAEQDPDEWWSALVRSVRTVIDQSGVSPDAIAALSVDATTCTVVALDASGQHLRPAIMWMDVRAADQARRIGESDHPARKSNDAQVLTMGARVIAPEAAELVLEHWLNSEFEGGRSAPKVDKMKAVDARHRGEQAAFR